MKAYIATALVTALLPLSVMAQGTVNFSSANANQTVRDRVTNVAVGAGYKAALYWGALGSTEAQLVQLGASFAVTAGNGFIINGGTRTTGAGTAAGTQGLFQVRAWNGPSATFEGTSASDYVGRSAIFQNATGDPNSQPPGTPSALAGWTSPVLVAPVPEPTTIALAALGLAGLVLIRRKK